MKNHGVLERDSRCLVELMCGIKDLPQKNWLSASSKPPSSTSLKLRYLVVETMSIDSRPGQGEVY